MNEKKLYGPVLMLIGAAFIALFPSVLTWNLHILSLSDPSVVIGLVCCYLFAVVDAFFGVRFIAEYAHEHSSKRVVSKTVNKKVITQA